MPGRERKSVRALTVSPELDREHHEAPSQQAAGELTLAGIISPSRKGSTDMASFHFRIKSGKKGSAVDHADYISRAGRFAVKDDLVDSDAGNLPDWAQGDPRAFWRAADKYVR